MRSQLEAESNPNKKLVIYTTSDSRRKKYFKVDCGPCALEKKGILLSNLCYQCGRVLKRAADENIPFGFACVILSSDIAKNTKIQVATEKEAQQVGVPLILKIS